MEANVKGMQQAMESVRIKLRIAKARADYYKRHDEMPTVLYLGQEDYYDLRRECDYWEVFSNSVEHPTFMGMLIMCVDRKRHLDVSAP